MAVTLTQGVWKAEFRQLHSFDWEPIYEHIPFVAAFYWLLVTKLVRTEHPAEDLMDWRLVNMKTGAIVTDECIARL